METRIGIHGIGIYLPETVRKNDWWPRTTVERWQQGRASGLQSGVSRPEVCDGAAAVVEAMSAFADDPFKGALERRIAPDDMWPSELEIRAAREALARAQVGPSDIEVCLAHSVTPDFINTPNACRIHHALGLPERCLSMSVDGMCNAFQMQLTLAQRLLQSRPGKFALLVQSSTLPRVTSPEDPASAWFGEGAAAVVVGPVAPDVGILATAHFTDGSKFDGLVFGVEGARWHDEGKIQLYMCNRKTAQKVILDVADHAKQAIEVVLSECRHRADEVAFYAAHQGTAWLREATQRHAGLCNARFVDTFSRFGSLSAANIPLILSIAERETMLTRGDLVVCFSGGSGETWSATALRWGTA